MRCEHAVTRIVFEYDLGLAGGCQDPCRTRKNAGAAVIVVVPVNVYEKLM